MKIIVWLALVLVLAPAAASAQRHDPKEDIRVVERQIQIEQRAYRIYRRARKRARFAVKNSSVGKGLRKVHSEIRKEKNELKRRAYSRQAAEREWRKAAGYSSTFSHKQRERFKKAGNTPHARRLRLRIEAAKQRYEQTVTKLEAMKEERSQIRALRKNLIPMMTPRFALKQIRKTGKRSQTAIALEKLLPKP